MNQVRAKRYEKGVTITDVAKATGLARKTVRGLEQGATPHAPTARAIADYFECEIGDLWPAERPSTDLASLGKIA